MSNQLPQPFHHRKPFPLDQYVERVTSHNPNRQGTREVGNIEVGGSFEPRFEVFPGWNASYNLIYFVIRIRPVSHACKADSAPATQITSAAFGRPPRRFQASLTS